MDMKKSTFRKKVGLLDIKDQHVSHIIAHANGGAENTDNFMFLGSELNIVLSNKCMSLPPNVIFFLNVPKPNT